MRRRILLSDDMVEARLQEHERLQYALTLKGPIMFWQAEVIGPFDSPYFGRSANATTPDNAVKRLKEQLERNGFIGRLVEGPDYRTYPHR